MNEERNPYLEQQDPFAAQEGALNQPKPYAPQPPYHPPVYGGYAPPQTGGGAAKAFGIVSFVAGCISIFAALLCLLAVVSSGTANAASFSLSVVYSLLFGAPGLVFGILALVKRTRLFPLALLGMIFNGLLLTELLFNVMLMLFHL